MEFSGEIISNIYFTEVFYFLLKPLKHIIFNQTMNESLVVEHLSKNIFYQNFNNITPKPFDIKIKGAAALWSKMMHKIVS